MANTNDPDAPLDDFEDGGAAGGVGHLVNNYKKCPVDPSHQGYDVRNYDEMWRDGDVHCAQCGAFIRTYDAG
jgi:hypothetical protein